MLEVSRRDQREGEAVVGRAIFGGCDCDFVLEDGLVGGCSCGGGNCDVVVNRGKCWEEM